MRKVFCDHCETELEMNRKYQTIVPKPFLEVKVNDQFYEFCSNECMLNELPIIVAESKKVEIKQS